MVQEFGTLGPQDFRTLGSLNCQDLDGTCKFFFFFSLSLPSLHPNEHTRTQVAVDFATTMDSTVSTVGEQTPNLPLPSSFPPPFPVCSTSPSQPNSSAERGVVTQKKMPRRRADLSKPHHRSTTRLEPFGGCGVCLAAFPSSPPS